MTSICDAVFMRGTKSVHVALIFPEIYRARAERRECFSTKSTVSFVDSRAGFQIHTSSRKSSLESLRRAQRMTNGCSFRLGYRDCYSTTSATTHFWHRRRHYFSLNETALGSAERARIWETQNYVGFILADESLLSRDLLIPFQHRIFLSLSFWPIVALLPSFPGRARITIPREPVIFTPKWPVSSNWTTIIRTIATRIIATVMSKITAPEVISLIVKDCSCLCLRRGRW